MKKAKFIEERKTFVDKNGLPCENCWRLEMGENFTINTLISSRKNTRYLLGVFFKGM
ncbi:hypothetical protein [Flagellimonas myxillae]|uniref:hypothetical protein n=1 Tax=Flagellimonas myxillae TaxID=2942214 RepID=UPI00201E9749|nr:hypothetical protein [Muricauda myxillae]MCL6267111.1 hypothetical protein [Muricauda myxillae]